MPDEANDILVGVLHGTGRAQQPAEFRKWIDETMAKHSKESALWRPRPKKNTLEGNVTELNRPPLSTVEIPNPTPP